MHNGNLNNKFNNSLKDKLVVADTSALLTAGTDLINDLPECCLIIPTIVVRELEDKRSHTTLGYQAREWLRLIEKMRSEYGQELVNSVPLNNHSHIRFAIEPNHIYQESLPLSLRNLGNDATILAVAKNLHNELLYSRHELKHNDEEHFIAVNGGNFTISPLVQYGKNGLVLLSNDTPMRIHATMELQLESCEYSATSASGATPFSGKDEVLLPSEEYADILTSYGTEHNSEALLRCVEDHMSREQKENNRLFITAKLKESGDTVNSYIYSGGKNKSIKPCNRHRVMNIIARSQEQDTALEYLQASPFDLPIVSISGNAGTGKTLLSVAAGLNAQEKHLYQRVIVLRSLHEMGQGQELGFLPGTVEEKMESWSGAVYDAIDVLASSGMNYEKSNKQVRANDENFLSKVAEMRSKIEVSPITFLRGRSLSNSYIILDEAQNFSRNEILNILSRAGEGTKMVMLSDPLQVDNRFLQSGKDADIWSVIDDLRTEDLFAHITLSRSERSRVAELSSLLLSKDHKNKK